MMISNWKTPFVLHDLYTYISGLWGLITTAFVFLEYSNSGKLSKSEDVSEALLNYVKKQQKNKSEEETSAGEDQWRVPNDVTQLLDSVSSQSIAGCMNLLDRLNIVEEAESEWVTY